MSKPPILKALGSISFIFITQIVLSPSLSARANEPTPVQLEKAAKILCQALSDGKSPDVARDAARVYLITEVGSKNLLNGDNIRQQLRPLVLNQCPEQAKKLVGR
jgi:hypothetical protein